MFTASVTLNPCRLVPPLPLYPPNPGAPAGQHLLSHSLLCPPGGGRLLLARGSPRAQVVQLGLPVGSSCTPACGTGAGAGVLGEAGRVPWVSVVVNVLARPANPPARPRPSGAAGGRGGTVTGPAAPRPSEDAWWPPWAPSQLGGGGQWAAAVAPPGRASHGGLRAGTGGDGHRGGPGAGRGAAAGSERRPVGHMRLRGGHRGPA